MIAVGVESHAAVGELVLQVANGHLVAGDDPRGEDAGVPVPQAHMRMGALGDPRQGRADLALAAGAQVEDVVVGKEPCLRVADEGLGVGEQAHGACGAGHPVHGTSHEADPPIVGLGGADRGVHPRDV